MARYFRADANDSPNDLELLPEALRERSDIITLAQDAEDDVLDHYTRPNIDSDSLATVLDVDTVVQRFVWLKGYAVDPANAAASFASAYRREIAAAIRWRAAWGDKKPNLTTEAAGDPQTSKTYRDDAERRLPPDFGRALRPYVIQRAYWAV